MGRRKKRGKKNIHLCHALCSIDSLQSQWALWIRPTKSCPWQRHVSIVHVLRRLWHPCRVVAVSRWNDLSCDVFGIHDEGMTTTSWNYFVFVFNNLTRQRTRALRVFRARTTTDLATTRDTLSLHVCNHIFWKQQQRLHVLIDGSLANLRGAPTWIARPVEIFLI